jgi:hypothetical protein
MSDWEQTLKDLMPLAAAAGMLAATDTMTRAVVGPELEKRLGRPLTDGDWQIYWKEVAAKQQCMAWANSFIQCFHQIVDCEKIRRFVWEEDG